MAIRLKKVGDIQIATCTNCTRQWQTRKKEGPKSCRYCQVPAKVKK